MVSVSAVSPEPIIPAVAVRLLDGGALLAHDGAHLAVLQDDADGAHGLCLQLIMQQRLHTVHGCIKGSAVLVLHILGGHDLRAEQSIASKDSRPSG